MQKLNFKLIALHGPKGCGKSTIARYLVGARGFQSLSFAQPIRDMIKAGLLVDLDSIPAEEKELPIMKFGRTPRTLMQTLGTEWGRYLINTEIWVILMRERLLGMSAICSGASNSEEYRLWADHTKYGLTHVVIDDLRFGNEAALVKELGGQIIRIFNPTVVTTDNHPSENGLPDDYPFDGLILNNPGLGLDSTFKEVDRCLQTLL